MENTAGDLRDCLDAIEVDGEEYLRELSADERRGLRSLVQSAALLIEAAEAGELVAAGVEPDDHDLGLPVTG